MQNENFTNTCDLLGALAEAMNFINPDIENHHQQTAYLAYMLARHLGLCSKSIEQTVYAVTGQRLPLPLRRRCA